MKKKIFITLIAIVTSIFVASCGGSEGSENQTTSSNSESSSVESSTPSKTSESDNVTIITTTAAEEEQQPIISDSGWYSSQTSFGDMYVYYGVKINNPNVSKTMSFPTLTITAKDENGTILSSENQVFFNIMPGDTISYGGFISCSAAPQTVEFGVSCSDFENTTENSDPYTSDFSFSNVSEVPGNYDRTKVTGEITNNFNDNVDMAAVTILYKNNGAIVSGYTSFVDNLVTGQTIPFELEPYDVPEHTEIEISAQTW